MTENYEDIGGVIMSALQCDICGGKLKMSSGEIAVCESCGMEHTKERVKEKVQEIKGTVEIKGSTAGDIVHRAETFIELGEFGKAYEQFKQLTELFPEDYRGWWGLIRCHTNDFKDEMSLDDTTGLWFQRAIKFCDETTVSKLKDTYQSKIELRNHMLEQAKQEELREKQSAEYEKIERYKDILKGFYEGKHYHCNYEDGYVEFSISVVIKKNGKISVRFGDSKIKDYTVDKKGYLNRKGSLHYYEIIDINKDKLILNHGKKQYIFEATEARGCYIATAIYGSYEAPEVLVLRKFRDEVLQNSLLGKAFINTYYLLSPPVAKWLKGTNKINAFVKKILDKCVSRLERKY